MEKEMGKMEATEVKTVASGYIKMEELKRISALHWQGWSARERKAAKFKRLGDVLVFARRAPQETAEKFVIGFVATNARYMLVDEPCGMRGVGRYETEWRPPPFTESDKSEVPLFKISKETIAQFKGRADSLDFKILDNGMVRLDSLGMQISIPANIDYPKFRMVFPEKEEPLTVWRTLAANYYNICSRFIMNDVNMEDVVGTTPMDKPMTAAGQTAHIVIWRDDNNYRTACLMARVAH